MIDLTHYVGNDLSIGPTGDIATSTATDLGQQRVVRRLLTNPGEYIWHNDYGAGVGSMVGTTMNENTIKGIIRGQISKEAAVSLDPVPVIDVQETTGGQVTATIKYADADTGEPVVTPPITIG